MLLECQNAPETIANGTVTKNSTNNVPGTVITYVCNDRFEISTSKSEFICESSGQWKDYDAEPKCIFGKLVNYIFLKRQVR